MKKENTKKNIIILSIAIPIIVAIIYFTFFNIKPKTLDIQQPNKKKETKKLSIQEQKDILKKLAPAKTKLSDEEKEKQINILEKLNQKNKESKELSEKEKIKILRTLKQ